MVGDGLVGPVVERVDLGVGRGDAGVLKPRQGLAQQRRLPLGGLFGLAAEQTARERVRVLGLQCRVVRGFEDLLHAHLVGGWQVAQPLADGLAQPFGVFELFLQCLGRIALPRLRCGLRGPWLLRCRFRLPWGILRLLCFRRGFRRGLRLFSPLRGLLQLFRLRRGFGCGFRLFDRYGGVCGGFRLVQVVQEPIGCLVRTMRIPSNASPMSSHT